MFLFTLMKALYDEKCFLQTLFVLAIFTFLPGLFGYIEKRLDKKAMLFSKFIMPWTVQLRITIHISLNVCDVINFEINLGFLTEPVFYITKKLG